MRISAPISYSGDPVAAARRIVELERVGLDMAWVAEAYGFDGPSLMGYLAATTHRIQIGSAILPIFTRTPTLLAMTAAGVDALSGGRCVLGIGASGPQVVEGWHGVEYDHPLERTREIVTICRRAWAREEPLVAGGPHYHLPLPAERGTGLGKALKIITNPVRREIPIFIAALGDRNVEQTAEIAEGWIPLLFVPERASVFDGPLRRGLAKRPAAQGALEIVAGGFAAIADRDEAKRLLDAYARPMAALYIGGMGARGRNFYNALVRRYGWAQAAQEIQDLYLAGRKAEAAAAVPDELLQLTNLCGDEGFVQERVAAYRDAGVTILNVSPVGTEPVRVIEAFKEWTA